MKVSFPYGIELRYNSFELGALRAKKTLGTLAFRKERFLALSHARQAFEWHYSTIDLDNWREKVEEILVVSRPILRTSQRQLIKTYVARLIERAYYSHVNAGVENELFRERFYNFLYALDDDMRQFFQDGRDPIKLPYKRQPSLVESFEATTQRFDFIRSFSRQFRLKNVEAVLVGGSMAYGPFLNVRAGTKNSDIDVIAIVNDGFLNANLRNSAVIQGVTDAEWNEFCDRIGVFEKLYNSRQADIFSHMFDIVEHGFSVSVHFIFPRTFDAIFGQGMMTTMDINADETKILKDYKNQPYKYLSCDRWDFSGNKIGYIVPKQERVERGYLAKLPGYIIRKKRFYPGLYHHVIMPAYISIGGGENGNDVGRSLDRFFEHVTRRLEIEQYYWQDVSLLRSHPRRSIFAPGKYKGSNSSIVTPYIVE